MPASSCSSTVDFEDEINNVDCVEQDDDDEIFPQLKKSEPTSFFFCHQTQFQRHLLYRYGNSLCLLDATYRTTKYALPLFFLAVKTSVGFSVVAEFVVQHETKVSIMLGLNTIKQWMDEAPEKPKDWKWEPQFFMTDFCEREITAIEEVFPETSVFICDFHREQSWTRWASKLQNGIVDEKEKVLSMLRQCAHACSKEQYSDAVNKLQNSDVWLSNSRLRNWFSKTESKRWVWAYRIGTGLKVNTNNGLERQNKIFKYQFLEEKKNSSLSGMISVLVTQYLPAMMFKYAKDNAVACETVGRSYNANVPAFLRNRPSSFIKHCMEKIELGHSIEEQEIQHVKDNIYEVKSQTDSNGQQSSYQVTLDNGKGTPSCECHAWKWTLMPCKHMFAVLSHSSLTWKDLPQQYRNSPFFNIDMDVIHIPVSQTFTDLSMDEEEVCSNNLQKVEEMEVGPAETQYLDLPCTKRGPKSVKALAICCREKLSLINNATYLCQKEDALTKLSSMLDEAVGFINENLYIEDGLVPESEPKKSNDTKTKQTSKVPVNENDTIQLVKKRKKSPRSKRSKTHETTSILETVENINGDVIIEGHADIPETITKETTVTEGIFPLKRDLKKEEKEAASVMEESAAKAMFNTDSTCDEKNAKHVTFNLDIGSQLPKQNKCGKSILKKRNISEKDPTKEFLDDLNSASTCVAIQPKKGTRYHVCGEVLEKGDFDTLLKDHWLNDKVINAYLALLMEKQNQKDSHHIFVMPSYLAVLWDVKRYDAWLYKKVQMSAFDWLFLPVNINNNHWVLLAANVPERTVTVVDSLNIHSNRALINKWRKYIRIRAELVGELDVEWKLGTIKSSTQNDGSSCGPFVLLNAFCMCHELQPSCFNTYHTKLMRRRVHVELMAAAKAPPSQRTVCDALECLKPGLKNPWICCNVCGRWCHFKCVCITHAPAKDFVCPVCVARYE